ncbi:MAG: hypothetical protein ABIK07_12070, partial [Planctomycetota bacterium]
RRRRAKIPAGAGKLQSRYRKTAPGGPVSLSEWDYTHNTARIGRIRAGRMGNELYREYGITGGSWNIDVY